MVLRVAADAGSGDEGRFAVESSFTNEGMEYFIICPVAGVVPPRMRAGGGDGDGSDGAADLLAELSISGTRSS